MAENGTVTRRIGQLESHVGELKADMHGLSAEVRGIAHNMDTLALGLKDLTKAMGHNNKINWGWLISAVGLFMAFNATLLTPIYGDLRETKEIMTTHTEKLGHPLSQSKAIEFLENQTHANKEWILDHDKNVSGINAAQWERLESLKQRIDKIENEQSRRTQKVYTKP